MLSLTPGLRPGSKAEMPFLVVWERKYMARNQVARGSLADWKREPSSRQKGCLRTELQLA